MHGGLSAFFNNEAEQILEPSACFSPGNRRSTAAVLGQLHEAHVPGRRLTSSSFAALSGSGNDSLCFLGGRRPSRAHAEFLQTADALAVGPHPTVKRSAVSFLEHAGKASEAGSKEAGVATKLADAYMNKAGDIATSMKGSEAEVALERGEIAQQVAEEAKAAAEHAEEADRGLEQVEHAVLWFNAVLTGVLFAGVWVTHRGYNQWLERKKELGRAWQAVQLAGMAPGYAPTAGNWPSAPDSASVAADVSVAGIPNAGPAPLVQLPSSTAAATPTGASGSASVPRGGASTAAATDAAPASPPAPSAVTAPGTASTVTSSAPASVAAGAVPPSPPEQDY